jgi:RNA polymerase-binding transcription factor DksA
VTILEHDIEMRLRGMRTNLIRGAGGPGLTESGQRELAEINGALLRLAEGRFGMCEECGGALGRQRLLADPTAVLCLSCLQKSRRGT